ncbi:molecular chaperone TorD family protein [Adlercreutzia sp. ZJ304]|uniref:TorD/DmsD family molecular chaperone n=1 Tax=Adlercreutzia sp. ZJ304 TaxID=2709791 RepID=UPI0013EA2E64|nr:molecular chaperone TorD family protein [Adlercreutzia sp. ZJ304]
MLTTHDAWQVRATICELLSISFRYPNIELAEAVTSKQWRDAALEITDVLNLNWQYENIIENDAEVFLHTLRVEATRMFIGLPVIVSPYEGIWRAKDDGVQGLLFVNPHSMDVERFCKACGLGQPEGTNEPLDHIASELELLEYLALLCTAEDTQDANEKSSENSQADFPGGCACAAYKQFMEEHALTWIPRFADKVCEQTRIPFYRNAASLLKCALGALY